MTQVTAASTSTPIQVQVQQPTHVQAASANQTTQSHVIQIQQPQNVQAAQQVQQAGVQIVQVVTNTGEIQQIPVNITRSGIYHFKELRSLIGGCRILTHYSDSAYSSAVAVNTNADARAECQSTTDDYSGSSTSTGHHPSRTRRPSKLQ